MRPKLSSRWRRAISTRPADRTGGRITPHLAPDTVSAHQLHNLALSWPFFASGVRKPCCPAATSVASRRDRRLLRPGALHRQILDRSSAQNRSPCRAGPLQPRPSGAVTTSWLHLSIPTPRTAISNRSPRPGSRPSYHSASARNSTRAFEWKPKLRVTRCARSVGRSVRQRLAHRR